MNDIDTLRSLSQAVELRYRLRQAEFHKLLAAETALRKELRLLDERVADSENRDHSEMRSIGADILWKGWVGRTKRSLNSRLAMVLAQKEARIAAVRAEYGRVMTMSELLETAIDLRGRDIEKKRRSQAIDIHLVRSSKNQ